MHSLYVVRKKTNLNNIIMRPETNYLAPYVMKLEISAEGILCESTAGAGTLDDNPWGGLGFGEDTNN